MRIISWQSWGEIVNRCDIRKLNKVHAAKGALSRLNHRNLSFAEVRLLYFYEKYV